MRRRRGTNWDGSPRCRWKTASPKRWRGCARRCNTTAMSKKTFDSLVGFAQTVTNLLVLGGTYLAVFSVRTALGHPYLTENTLAVEGVFPYLAALYVVLWLAYRLPAYYETTTYEGVLSQVFVQLSWPWPAWQRRLSFARLRFHAVWSPWRLSCR